MVRLNQWSKARREEMRKTRKLQVLGAIFAISLLAVTACGSDDDDSAGQHVR